MRRLLIAAAFVLAAGACGPNPKLHLADGPTVGSDAPTPPATFTTFVINLVLNESHTPTPAAYTTFSTLPDPDGADNNTSAYSSLFQ
jgi:hypothetical protein